MKPALIKKLAIIGVVLLVVILFWLFDLQKYLSLDYIKAQQESFRHIYHERPAMFLLGYGLIYVLVTAFSLPGAAVLTLAGGGLFGFGWGLVTVSFASSLGATLACFFARYVLRDSVQKKFGHKLGAINQGVEREGAFYLFTLRLVPVFPFFIINLLMGLTPIKLWTFYWVSQLGMLPGTVVFVNAGKELAKIDSLAGILSPSLLVSFAVLGLFPLVVKKALAWYRDRTGKAGLGQGGD